jgi:hypothetical protein
MLTTIEELCWERLRKCENWTQACNVAPHLQSALPMLKLVLVALLSESGGSAQISDKTFREVMAKLPQAPSDEIVMFFVAPNRGTQLNVDLRLP